MSGLLFYMHGGSGNHGCEAIVTGLLGGGKLKGAQEEALLLSMRADEDRRYLPQNLCRITEEKHVEDSRLVHMMLYGCKKITGDAGTYLRYRYRPAFENGRSYACAVSIGGDNYCYPLMVDELMAANAVLHKKGIRTILLGCSVEPSLLKSASEGGAPDAERGGHTKEELLQDLLSYHTVLARESLTFTALKEAQQSAAAQGVKGADKARILLVPDPAFLMEPAPAEETVYPPHFAPGKTIGLNLSPMAEDYEANKGCVRESFLALIRHILETSDDAVALIPHVIWKNSNDLTVLQELYETARSEVSPEDRDRIMLVQDQPARALKRIISECRLFIGARTHSTIAAYSTGVPTLVIGYSVKAKGIAKDLFGDAVISGETYRQENYVLPVQELTDPQQLVLKYDRMRAAEPELRAYLRKKLPDYIREAEQNLQVIQEVWAE